MKMSKKYIIDKKLERFKKSKFRSSFHLFKKDKEYVLEKGYPIIKLHAIDFLTKRLAPYPTLNDGKQTPMRGHPVFIAQHATATCCRKCLKKWYHIPDNIKLTEEEINDLVDIIMVYIYNEVNNLYGINP